MSRTTKFILLTSLYFSQGLPYGFFKQALPVLMREQGASLSRIGWLSVLVLPWALKFLWAPYVDGAAGGHGRRKRWIGWLQALGCVLFLVLAFWDGDDGYTMLLWGFAIANTIAATQDIASDGLAVLILRPHERGLGNGIQVAGYRVGMVVGGGLILMLIPSWGMRGALIAIAVLVALATLPLFHVTEPVIARPVEGVQTNLLWRRLLRPGFPAWLAVIAFYKFGDAIGSSMLSPFLKDRGLGMREIGVVLGTVGFVSGLIGALAGGWLVERLGRLRAVVVLGVIQAACVAAYALLDLNLLGGGWLNAICAAEHLSGGMATAAVFTVMMDACEPQSASTDYTVQASFVVMATTAAGVLAGYVAQVAGYAWTFGLSGGLSLLAPILFGLTYAGLSDRLGMEVAARPSRSIPS